MTPAPKTFIARDEELLSQSEAVVYKQPATGPDLQAYLFLPADGRVGLGRPALVFFHASGWDSGRVAQFAPQAMRFAQRGCVSILADYRTRASHDATPLQAMQDARSAFRWVRHYADELGVDPSRLAGIGSLAGAHIAAAAAMKGDLPDDATDPESLSGRPDALILINPLVEVTKGSYGSKAFAETGTPIGAANLSAHVAKDLPPTLILHGTDDRFAPIGPVVKFAKKSQQKGNVCDLIPFEGRQHGFFNLNVDPATHSQCNDLMDRFLVHLGFLAPDATAGDETESVRVLD